MPMSELEFGKLQSDVAHIYKTVESINRKLDNAVSMAEYVSYKQESDKINEDILSRISALETLEQIRQNSFWHKVGLGSEKAVISVVVAGILAAVGASTYIGSQVSQLRGDIDAISIKGKE